jgi:hypothetical protein
MKHQNSNDLESSAVKAIAAASKTPFRTAFKITFGIALAQLTIAALVFGGLIFIGTIVLLLARMQ